MADSKAREISDYSNKQTTKNAIINGNFDFWQRGTSVPPSTLTQYLSDRWLTSVLLSTSFMNRVTFPVGQTEVPNNPTYYMRQQAIMISGAVNFVRMDQRIENVNTFSNDNVTLTFWARADAAANIAVEFVQNFGTGGAPSADVESIGVTTIPLGTSWQKFQVNTTIPSISGATLGTNNDHFLQLGFWLDAGSNHDARTNSLGQQTGNYEFSQIQLEKGNIPSDFDNRTISEELLLCQRFFCRTFNDNITFPNGGTGFSGVQATQTSSTGAIRETCTYPVKMRSTPTITSYNPTQFNSNFRHLLDVNDLVPVLNNAGDTNFNFTSLNGAGTPFTGYGVHWTADAEL